MAGIRVEGNTTGNVAEVDNYNNLRVALPSGMNQAGYAVMLGENDSGSILGNPTRSAPRISADDRLVTGFDTPIFDYDFTSLTQDTGVWRHLFTTMTATASTNGVLFNANSTLTTLTGCSLHSFKQFALMGNAGMLLEFYLAFTASPLANQVFEFGYFLPTVAQNTPIEGVYFRYTSTGLTGAYNYAGVEVESGILLTPSAFNDSESYSFQIRLNNREVAFYKNDAKIGELVINNANGIPYASKALPVAMQFRNSNTVSGAPVMQAKVQSVHIDQRDIALNAPFSHLQNAMYGGQQGWQGGSMGTLALYTNNLTVGSGAALSNTVATGVFSGLGGQFSVTPTLAVGTDGILANFQVPTGSINFRSKTLIITGVRIQGAVTTALTGGPVIYAYSLAYGHTAVSLATTESTSFATATAKAPRRVALGTESYAANATLGTLGAGVYMSFQSPIPVNPGEFVCIAAKNLGIVTTAGVISLFVTYDYYTI